MTVLDGPTEKAITRDAASAEPAALGVQSARSAVRHFTLPAMAVFMISASTLTSQAASTRANHFRLDNGMQVVVVPDRRAPVVTHMVWYRVGGADEPRGVSGIAHFLEHLMFKSTRKLASGEFSKTVSRLGGQDNAFTGQDVTAYHQRISKDHLPKVMAMEADRMVNLDLSAQEVTTERKVILEERRSRVDANPNSILDEQMDATLFQAHPYGTPVIGWEHEMAKLSREDALAFYKHYYAPNNALLVVTGDVDPEDVLKLAKSTYGLLSANPAVIERVRNAEPPHPAARRVELIDHRTGKPLVRRYYLAPSYRTAAPLEAEALDLLMKVTGGGSTSRLYKRLVVDLKIASSAGGWYSGAALDSGKIGLAAVAADGSELAAVEHEMDAVLAEVRANGITQAELDRARKSYLAEYVYESDNQSSLARRYGWAMTVGRSIDDIEGWPDRVAKVTLDDVRRAAERHLDIRRSVTGTLRPAPAPAVKIAPNRS